MKDVETKILVPKDNGKTWDETIRGDQSYWCTALTMAEYNKITTEENKPPSTIRGDLREMNGWSQLVWLPTSTCEEALCWLAFHNSGMHVEPCNETILMAFKPDSLNMAYHVGQGLVNYFQRAHSIQVMQMRKSGHELNNVKVNNFKVLKVNRDCTNKFEVHHLGSKLDFAFWPSNYCLHNVDQVQGIHKQVDLSTCDVANNSPSTPWSVPDNKAVNSMPINGQRVQSPTRPGHGICKQKKGGTKRTSKPCCLDSSTTRRQ